MLGKRICRPMAFAITWSAETPERIRAGISADQVAVAAIGRQARFPSIELGVEPARQGGKCDSGYACAYSNNISWRSETTPSGAEINPRLVFERLFASSSPKLA